MNSFITKKAVVYTVAIIASLAAVVILFTNTIESVVPAVKNNSTKVQIKRTQTQSKKTEIVNFEKQVDSQAVEKIEFRGKIYTQPEEKEVYTEEEKLKILNNF